MVSPRRRIDSRMEPIPFKQEGFNHSGTLAEEIRETGILVYQKKQAEKEKMKFFPDSAKADEIRCDRTGQCRQMISPIVPLEKLQEAFVDFGAGKTLKPLVKLNE
jgi:hypothetical protein